jgi:hypothetical protein
VRNGGICSSRSGLAISAPIRGRKLSRYQQKAFENTAVAVSGAYSMNLEFDAKYAVVPIEMAAELLQYDSAVSALEVQLDLVVFEHQHSIDVDGGAALRRHPPRRGPPRLVRIRSVARRRARLLDPGPTHLPSEKRHDFLHVRRA